MMGPSFLDRLAREDQGEVLSVTQILDQVVVERASGLRRLAGGVAANGAVQGREIDDPPEVCARCIDCAEPARSLDSGKVKDG